MLFDKTTSGKKSGIKASVKELRENIKQEINELNKL